MSLCQCLKLEQKSYVEICKLRKIANILPVSMLDWVLLVLVPFLSLSCPHQYQSSHNFGGDCRFFPPFSWLGKGLIKCPPETIWQTIVNPYTRYIHDEMLKDVSIISDLGNGMKLSMCSTTWCTYLYIWDCFYYLPSRSILFDLYLWGGRKHSWKPACFHILSFIPI